MYKIEIVNGVEYHFDSSRFASVQEYIDLLSKQSIGEPEDMIRTIDISGRIVSNIPRSAAKIYGISAESFDLLLAEQQASDLFESEKNIALQILNDFNLGTGEQEITGSDVADVRAYIQSIDPSKGLKSGHLQRAKIPRPSVFDRYKKNPYEL